jgi:hypothetical protein
MINVDIVSYNDVLSARDVHTLIAAVGLNRLPLDFARSAGGGTSPFFSSGPMRYMRLGSETDEKRRHFFSFRSQDATIFFNKKIEQYWS